LPWEGEGWRYAFSEEATRGLRLTIGKMEGELLLLVMIVSGRGPLSSQANDNWTIGLLLGANVKQQMANRRRRGGVCGIGGCKDSLWTRTGKMEWPIRHTRGRLTAEHGKGR
jgi:hypothetical protein